jgi:hypothetical protein
VQPLGHFVESPLLPLDCLLEKVQARAEAPLPNQADQGQYEWDGKKEESEKQHALSTSAR